MTVVPAGTLQQRPSPGRTTALRVPFPCHWMVLPCVGRLCPDPVLPISISAWESFVTTKGASLAHPAHTTIWVWFPGSRAVWVCTAGMIVGPSGRSVRAVPRVAFSWCSNCLMSAVVICVSGRSGSPVCTKKGARLLSYSDTSSSHVICASAASA